MSFFASGERSPMSPSMLTDREHQEDAEQEQRDRRDEAGALTVDIAAGQFARLPGEHRQRAPDLALEIEARRGRKSWKKALERPVDMRVLAAGVAISAGQLRAAIEAIRLVRVAVAAFAGLGLDRAAEQRRRLPHRRVLRIPTMRAPFATDIRRASTLMLAVAHGAHRSPRRLVQPGAPRRTGASASTRCERSGSTRCGGWSRRAIR